MYTPNNVQIFIAAFSGCISGMAVAEKVLTNTNPTNYDAIAAVAGAFAQSFDTEWGLRPTTSLDVSIVEEECEGTWEGRYPLVSNPSNVAPATFTPQCKALIALVTSSAAYFAGQGVVPPPPNGCGTTNGPMIDLAVNTASVDMGWKVAGSPTAAMRVGAIVNPPGAYNGGGTGNKSILGAKDILNGLPISSLVSTSIIWKNLLGPAGPFFNPPGAANVVVPYMNFLIDFDPLGAHDLRYLSVCDSGLAPAITAAIGVYTNPGGLNELNYAWDNSLDVLIVNAPPDPVPGGVPVNISVGPSWLDNTYKWSALVAANPTAVFVDAFPAVFGSPTGAAGAPVGAIAPAIAVVSGNSSNATKSGKHILEWLVNGVNVLAA